MPSCAAVASGTPVPEEIGTNPKPACVEGVTSARRRPAPRHVLGISAYYHDAAAALLCQGKIVCAAQEERFSRKKNDADFPEQAVQFCLRHARLEPAQLDAVVFYDKPVLKFSRLLETYLAVAAGG